MVEFTSLNREVNINRSYITMYDELSKRKEMDSESKESYDFIKNKIQSAKWLSKLWIREILLSKKQWKQ